MNLKKQVKKGLIAEKHDMKMRTLCEIRTLLKFYKIEAIVYQSQNFKCETVYLNEVIIIVSCKWYNYLILKYRINKLKKHQVIGIQYQYVKLI